MVRVSHLRTIAAGLALGLLAGACTSDDGEPPPPSGPTGNSSGMVAVAASTDLYRGDPQRLAFGLIMPDNSLVSFGTVDVAFSLLGSAGETAAPEPGPTATATFVPTFGMPEATALRIESPSAATCRDLFGLAIKRSPSVVSPNSIERKPNSRIHLSS